MGRHVSHVLAWPLWLLVIAYRYTLSPLLGNNCRFQPSCSEYAAACLREHGAFRGVLLAARRIARCHPWGGDGYDPVPDSHAGDDRRSDRHVDAPWGDS